MNEKIILYPLNDDITVKIIVIKKKTAAFKFRITDKCTVEAIIPKGCSEKALLSVISQKKSFFLSNIDRLRNMTLLSPIEALQSGDTVTVFNRLIPVSVIKSDKNKAEYSCDGAIIYSKCPADYILNGKIYRKLEKESALRYYNESIKAYFPLFSPPCRELPSVEVRHMKSMWGNCCKEKNHIKFSEYLIRRPKECVDYVILHEMTHLIYANHGSDFKAKLKEVCPECDRIRKLLNENISLK